MAISPTIVPNSPLNPSFYVGFKAGRRMVCLKEFRWEDHKDAEALADWLNDHRRDLLPTRSAFFCITNGTAFTEDRRATFTV